MYKKGQIIFKEGDKLDKAYIILEGKVRLTSTLGYSMIAEESSIIAEWMMLDDNTSPEDAIAESDVELADVEEIAFNYELLERSFDRLAHVNKTFSTDLKPLDEVKETIKKVTKGSWKFFEDFKKSKYFIARKLIGNEKYEEAYEKLLQIPKGIFGEETDREIEILKTLCLQFIDPKAAVERYHLLRRNANRYKNYISYTLFMEIITKGVENISSLLKIYLKHGIYIPPRTILMVEGELGDDMIFILKGYVRVVRYSSKDPVLLTFLGPSEFVGEVSTLGDQPRTATVVVHKPIQALLFSKKSLRNSLESNKKFALEILKASLKRVQNMKKFKKTGQDIENKIRFLRDKWGIEELNRMEITLEELANFLKIDMRELINYLSKEKVAMISSDGTVKFNK